MLPLRPAPVELHDCNQRARSRWARLARALCGASKRCPVILAVYGLCPPCLMGQTSGWYSWQGGVRPYGLRRSCKTGQLVFPHPSTLRALVGPLWLAMSAAIPLSVDTPLPIILDWLEEAEWIDCEERHQVEDLAGRLPSDVMCQRAQLGHFSAIWPRRAPRRLAIQHARPLLLEKGSQQ